MMGIVMKKPPMVFIFVTASSLVHANVYTKNNSVLSLSPGNGVTEFNINVSHGNVSGICKIRGVAESVEAGTGQRNRWVYNDSSNACVAVISELNDGSVNVITRSCEIYCGVSAKGSMSGKYMMK